jgi:plastocyanin
MRAFSIRILGCLLLAGALLVVAGCTKTYVKKGLETQSNTVNINNCAATPDWVKVPRGQTLTWTVNPPDGHAYSIKFPDDTPVGSSSVSTGQPQNVTGDFRCNNLSWINPNYCEFQYNLIQDGSKTCPDPGVHVGPGGP